MQFKILGNMTDVSAAAKMPASYLSWSTDLL